MLAAAGFWVAATTPAGAQPAPAALGTVVVVHGLVDFPADVYLDGASTPALSGFEFRRVTDALALPAGMHRADLRRAGQPVTAPPALSGSFTGGGRSAGDGSGAARSRGQTQLDCLRQ